MPGDSTPDSGSNEKQHYGPFTKSKEPRLIFPSLAEPQPAADALNHVIEAWVIPRLLEEYLRESGTRQTLGPPKVSVLAEHDEPHRK